MTKHIAQVTPAHNSAEAWEERRIGAEEEFVAVAPDALQKQVEASIAMQLISLRLPDDLIEGFKFIAQRNNIRYQTLMRQCLQRFYEGEMKMIVRQITTEERRRKKAA